MKLNLDTLPFGRSDATVDEVYRVDVDELEDGELSVAGTLVIDSTEGRVLVSGTLAVTGRAECGRCLAGFPLAYDAEVAVQIVRAAGTDEVPDEGDAWIIHQPRGPVELDGPLREAVLLDMPRHLVCREDCKGLCPTCGADLNRETCDCGRDDSDPRWDGLPA